MKCTSVRTRLRWRTSDCRWSPLCRRRQIFSILIKPFYYFLLVVRFFTTVRWWQGLTPLHKTCQRSKCGRGRLELGDYLLTCWQNWWRLFWSGGSAWWNARTRKNTGDLLDAPSRRLHKIQILFGWAKKLGHFGDENCGETQNDSKKKSNRYTHHTKKFLLSPGEVWKKERNQLLMLLGCWMRFDLFLFWASATLNFFLILCSLKNSKREPGGVLFSLIQIEWNLQTSFLNAFSKYIFLIAVCSRPCLLPTVHQWLDGSDASI